MRKLESNPLCEDCLSRGVLTVATQVHHVTPLETATGAMKERLAYDFNNLRSLCADCHRAAHQNRKAECVRLVDDFFKRY